MARVGKPAALYLRAILALFQQPARPMLRRLEMS
jgi:hypothetical protein